MAMAQLHSDWFDWRSGCKTIQDITAHLLETGLYSDVAFTIQEPDEPPISMKAHQFILRARSPVFETMFNEVWRSDGTEISLNPRTNNAHRVTIVDTTPEYFELFLRFLYTDYFYEASTKETLLGLLYLAHKYIVVSLAQKCSEVLEKAICLKNVIEIYQVAELFQQYGLRDAAFEFMLKFARALVLQPQFLQVEDSLLKKLVMNDHLQIEEINLFRALLLWASNKTDHEDKDLDEPKNYGALNEIVPLVRFTIMDPQEFSSILEIVSGMLGNNEIIQIYKHLTTTAPMLRRSLPKLRFNAQRRLLSQLAESFPQRYTISLYLYAETCDRNRLSYIYGSNGRIHDENLQFTASHNVIIDAIGLFGPAPVLPTTPSDFNFLTHQVDLAIYCLDTKEHSKVIISRVRRTLLVPTDYDIVLETPVKVVKDRVYQIQLAFKGEETKHGVSRLSTVKANCAGNIVVFNMISPLLTDGLHAAPQGRIRSISFKMDN